MTETALARTTHPGLVYVCPQRAAQPCARVKATRGRQVAAYDLLPGDVRARGARPLPHLPQVSVFCCPPQLLS